MTGQTSSANFPTVLGSFQGGAAGGVDGFVTKLNLSGSALIYSTYLGGTNDDFGGGIAVDGLGRASVAGSTTSTDFPTTIGAFQTSNAGGFDAFVTKLNPTGTALVYSTYLGGAGDELANSMALDSHGAVHVVGQTDSTDFPTTAGAFQVTNGGGFDAFVAKLNTNGTSLLYSTYAGGTGDDQGFAMALDVAGNAYATGPSVSTNFPTTAGAFQTSGGSFVVKVLYAPVPAGLVPASGPTLGGTAVTLTAANFSGALTLTIGGTATKLTQFSPTQFLATTPAHAAGPVDLVVTASDGTVGTLVGGFTYVAAPELLSLNPTSGPTAGGSSVTLSGSSFQTGATVTLDGVAATNVSTVSATRIAAQTPAHAAGVVDILVTNPDGQSSTLAGGFTYGVPLLNEVSPSSGSSAGGSNVTLIGEDFASGASVTFGGTAATQVVIVGPTRITATTPAHAASTVDVIVTNPDSQASTLTGAFTFSEAPASAAKGCACGAGASGPALGWQSCCCFKRGGGLGKPASGQSAGARANAAGTPSRRSPSTVASLRPPSAHQRRRTASNSRIPQESERNDTALPEPRRAAVRARPHGCPRRSPEKRRFHQAPDGLQRVQREPDLRPRGARQ